MHGSLSSGRCPSWAPQLSGMMYIHTYAYYIMYHQPYYSLSFFYLIQYSHYYSRHLAVFLFSGVIIAYLFELLLFICLYIYFLFIYLYLSIWLFFIYLFISCLFIYILLKLVMPLTEVNEFYR